MSNSIINSLKRLERVGSETSVVTQKLKKSCEEIADRIFDICKDYSNVFDPHNEEISWTKIAGDYNKETKKHSNSLWIIETMGSKDLYYESVDNLSWENIMYNSELAEAYQIRYSGCVSRETCLAFAKHISNGLLNEVVVWVENKKKSAEKALEQLEENKAVL